MARNKKIRTVLEGSALAIVVIFPLVAIGWYIFGGNSSPDTPTPGATPQSVPATPSAAPASVSLAINNPSSVPTSVAAGEVVSFSFTVKNTAGGAASLSYKVYVIWRGGEQNVIDRNAIQLAGGEARSISESLKFETAGAAGVVYIEVEPSGPRIHFAMPR